ncbi:sensor histidine kinase [Streptomyces sp. YU58]|uniref:sensor histidine kinase n=1 Tax=Streptomyces sp. SX92 TaxID=3158972 RepID=UPI0027BA737A|nr:ATP-binding protein [Streptomyces coralus]WLW50666.1 ATP-binding protein [Streptomyces coralus]
MSHLRAPAARADRREGGRHGRPAARAVPALPETHIRPQLLRLAVLPPVAVALSGCAAVLFTVRSTGARPSLTLWCVLAGAVGVTCAGILIAAVAADRAARSVSDRIGALRRVSARGEADLRALVESLRRGEAAPQRTPRGGPPEDADDFELLAADLTRAHDGAVTAVVQATQLSSQAGSEQKLEVFLNLARRLQSLVHREISILDELENEIEDPDLLKGLFHVDHLATRIRRHAENLAVLGGAVSRRQWSNPVSMTEVLRSAIAEVEQYSRVKLVPPVDGELRGHAVADVIHLLAELVENATVFSAPHTQVLLRANLVTSGLAVEVEDRGLGMPVGEQARMNALLADPDQVNVASLLADGRIGLFVVSQLAKRHGIHVRLQTNIYGGVQAVLVVPQALLGSVPGAPGAVPQPPSSVPGTAGPGAAPGQRQARPGAEAGHRAAPIAPPAPPPTASSRPSSPRTAPPGVTSPGGTTPGGAPSATGSAASAPQQNELSEERPTVRMVPASVNGRSGAVGGGAPAPLPVRGAREARPTPAAAPPGIRPDDRHRVAEHTAAPPTPRAGTVRGTMGKPQLPRRRAQEHIVPQLRDAPAPRPESEYLAGHDPGLMAAFQRGVGLAETQQHLEATSGEPTPPTGPAHAESGHMGFGHMEPRPMESSGQPEGAHAGSAHTGATHTGLTHTGPTHTEATHTESRHLMDVRHVDLPIDLPADVHPIDRTRISEARGERDSGAVPRFDLDHTTRHDGSAPAG